MSLVLERENISLCEKGSVFEDRKRIECKTGVSTDSVKKIVFASAFPYVKSCEDKDKIVNYSGKVNFFICYLDQEDQIKKLECSSEFDGVFEKGEKMGRCFVTPHASIEQNESDLSGVHMLSSCQLEMSVQVINLLEKEYVLDGNNLIKEQNEIEISKLVGERTINYNVEEDFEVNYTISEVLFQRAETEVLSVQCGVGSVIVDGEVNLSAILLQSGEKRDIIKESKTFPFRVEVEIDDAMPTFNGVASLFSKSLKTDITVDEEQKKSQITASVSVGVLARAYKKEPMSVISDAFTLTEDIELAKERAKICTERACSFHQEKFTLKTNIEQLEVGAVLNSVLCEKAEIVSALAEANGISVTGVCSGTALFCDADGKLFSRKIESPFACLINVEILENEEFIVRALAKNMELKIISLDSGEINCDINFSVCVWASEPIELLKDVVVTGEKKQNDSAISVYIPLKDEGMFELAKRLNVSPSELVLTNKELQFPLTGDERIVVYRQK